MTTLSTSKGREVCFFVEDFEEQDRRNPNLVPNLEITFPPLGAQTVQVDVSRNLYCLLIEAPDLEIKDILAVFSQAGCKARVMKGEAGEQSR